MPFVSERGILASPFFINCRNPDIANSILEVLSEFVYQLVCSGQLILAKILRNNILEKVMFDWMK